MQPGQFLINKDGEKRKILGVCGELYGLSYVGGEGEYNYSSFGHWCSKKDLEERGWSLFEEPWVPGYSEDYWYVSSDGNILFQRRAIEDGSATDFRISAGNAHKTSKAAELYRQKLIERMGRKE